MTNLTITPGCVVLLAGFDDIPPHQFLVQEALKDCITGPLAGEYGEPYIALVLQVLSRPTYAKSTSGKGLVPAPPWRCSQNPNPSVKRTAISHS